MKGDLAKIGLAEIVKALSLIGKSGRLTISSGSEPGYIYLRKGQVIHAEDGKLKGEEALYALTLRETGIFTFDPTMSLVQRNINVGSESLFIGLSSRVDRYHYLLSRCPKLDARVHVENVEDDPTRYDQDTLTILRLLKRPIALEELLNRAALDRIKTLEIISSLHLKRLLKVSKSAAVAKDEDEEAVSEPAALSAALEANVKSVSIGEVIQILVLSRHNGHLTATWDDREGDLFIQNGNITYAAVEQVEGLGAAYRLLTWKDGACKFFANEVPSTQNIKKNIESIFVEGIDILAKFNQFMDEFPSLNAFVDVISVTGQETINEKEAKILKLVNENETLNDVIKHSPYSDVETLEIAAKLYAQRMIGLSKGLRGEKEVDYDKEADDLLKDLL